MPCLVIGRAVFRVNIKWFTKFRITRCSSRNFATTTETEIGATRWQLDSLCWARVWCLSTSVPIRECWTCRPNRGHTRHGAQRQTRGVNETVFESRGSRNGEEILVEAKERGEPQHPEVRYSSAFSSRLKMLCCADWWRRSSAWCLVPGPCR
jgi:hypothetical protein